MSQNKTQYEEATKDLKSREKSFEDLSKIPVERGLKALGRPDKDTTIVLVGGSNGKGSVVEMISHILRKNGHEVGSFKSPGLTSVRDRIRINGTIISKQKFVQLYDQISRLDISDDLSLFEYVTLMAFLEFKESKYAVVEVGLGGSKDATNAAENEYSVVTNVQKEHTSHLGETEEQIAKSICGIESKHNITGSKTAAEYLNNVHETDELVSFRGNPILGGTLVKMPFTGDYQVENFFTAAKTLEVMGELPEDQISESLMDLSIPGRMEVLQQKPLIILDGAHNTPAIQKILSNIPENSVILFACSKTKNPEKMISVLERKASSFVMTEFPPKHCYDSAKLSDLTEKSMAVSEPSKAFRKTIEMSGEEGTAFVTGSLYLIGRIKNIIE